MKATLEFDLPEEKEAYLAAVHGIDWALVVWDFSQLLRMIINEKETPNKVLNTLTSDQGIALSEQLDDMLSEHGVTLDMIS